MKILGQTNWVAGAFVGVAMAWPAGAQDHADAVLDTMIVCSEIADIPARVACYDGTVLRARQVRGNIAAERGGEERVPVPVTARERFGQESLPRERAPERTDRIDEISATVEAAREVRPGIYAIALDDGSRWQFTERVPTYYFAPKAGVQVTIARAAMGSYRMLVAGKSPVRVQRTR